MDIEFVRSRFIKHFDGETGNVYASPGRINLIGEHTDYNGGFVFPGAIDKGMIAEIKPNGTDKVRAYSIDLKDYVEITADVENFELEFTATAISTCGLSDMKDGDLDDVVERNIHSGQDGLDVLQALSGLLLHAAHDDLVGNRVGFTPSRVRISYPPPVRTERRGIT